MGFTFSIPFTPFFIQELGITEQLELKIWVSICNAATPLGLVIFSPIWGALADRYGRRLMLLRANFAAAIIVVLMGTVPSVGFLAALRFLQGAFTGTMTAAQTMVAAQTPQRRSGLALGSLSAGVFSGAMVGSAVGGIVADAVGYRTAFFVGGSSLLVAGLVVLFGLQETFLRPAPAPAGGSWGTRLRLAKGAIVVPILLLIVCMAFVRHFDRAFLPLLVQEIHHGVREGAAKWTGGLNAFCGCAGLLSGFTLGRLADRIPPARVAMLSALGAAVFLIPHGFVQSFGLLYAARFGMFYFAGGLDPIFQIWLSKITASEHRGSTFGWAASARSVGWLGAPLASGFVASVFSLRTIFFIGALLFLVLVVVIALVVKYVDRTRDRAAAGVDPSVQPFDSPL